MPETNIRVKWSEPRKKDWLSSQVLCIILHRYSNIEKGKGLIVEPSPYKKIAEELWECLNKLFKIYKPKMQEFETQILELCESKLKFFKQDKDDNLELTKRYK